MTDDESPAANRRAKTVGELLLAEAAANPEIRAHLIERWARASTWTHLEGIALAWTFDPRELESELRDRELAERKLPEDARHYLDLARRHFGPGYRVKPSSFIAWAHGIGLEFHPDWSEAIAQAEADAPPPPSRSDADRRREALIRHWARSPYWSVAEGVVLAHDLDPEVAVVRLVSGYDEPRIRAPAAARRLLDLAERAVEVGKLEEKTSPSVFMNWARSIGVECPASALMGQIRLIE